MNKVNINVEEMDYTTEEELKTLRTNLLFCGVDKKVINCSDKYHSGRR